MRCTMWYKFWTCFLPCSNVEYYVVCIVGAVPDASTLWSTCNHRPGHSSLATPQNASANLQYLQASFHNIIQTNSNTGSHRQGETQNHTAHAAAEQQTIPKSVNYGTIQTDTEFNIPMQRLI